MTDQDINQHTGRNTAADDDAGPPAPASPALLDRLERFYDAVPRGQARAEPHGPLVLFVRESPGHPFYARPAPGADRPATAAEITAVRARQRELGIPEAFEWVHDHDPGLLPAAEAAGLHVHHAPLMVLDPAAVADLAAPATTVQALDPAAPDFADQLRTQDAVGAVAFSHPGTLVGPPGTADRDQACRPAVEPGRLAQEAVLLTGGRLIRVQARTAQDGVLAIGAAQRVGGVAEIAGVGTLPAARRRGLAAAITAALVRLCRAAGDDLIFLSAADAQVARVYHRVGFRHVATACIAEPATTTP